jgi:hypothetical protein
MGTGEGHGAIVPWRNSNIKRVQWGVVRQERYNLQIENSKLDLQ